MALFFPDGGEFTSSGAVMFPRLPEPFQNVKIARGKPEHWLSDTSVNG